MGFDLLSFLTLILGGLNVQGLDQKIAAWLAAEGVKYPDLRDRADALAAWISQTLQASIPNLDPVAMKDTLWGIASDIVHGTAGVDPGAWQGGA